MGRETCSNRRARLSRDASPTLGERWPHARSTFDGGCARRACTGTTTPAIRRNQAGIRRERAQTGGDGATSPLGRGPLPSPQPMIVAC